MNEQPKAQPINIKEIEEALGRPLTKKEKFEAEMQAREETPPGEGEDDVEEGDYYSFEGKHVYLKMWLYFFCFIGTVYYCHTKISAYRDE